MTPLDELEKFYVELRGQAERQEIPVQQAMSTLQQKTVTDAAGVTWVVDPRRSTPTQAAFLSCSPGAQFLPAERSSFAQNFQAAQPGYQMAPMPGSMPPMPGAPAPMPGAPQPPAGPKRLESGFEQRVFHLSINCGLRVGIRDVGSNSRHSAGEAPGRNLACLANRQVTGKYRPVLPCPQRTFV